jgi:hypothetical protein
MKYNEPIRPKGIGKKQLGFPTGTAYTEMASDEADFIESQSPFSPAIVSLEKSIDAVGVSKASGIASAAEAHHKAQNYPFEMVGITNFAMSGAGGIYSAIPFANTIIQNDNFWFNPRDRYIYVNESGWYFVRVFFYSTAISGNIDWGLRVNTNVGNVNFGEVYENFIDYRTSSKWCTVTGTTLINLPNGNDAVNGAGRYGFKVDLYTTASFVSFLNTNTSASLQVFRLADLYESERKIFNKNV